MKKVGITIAVLSALAVAPAMAAEVQLYGILDTGIKIQKIGKANTTTTMESGQRSGSRVGIKGSEKINEDLEVGFVLENGFDTDTGALGDEDRLFNRNSYLYVKGDYGTLKLGRTGALSGGCNGNMFAGSATPFGITWGLAGANKTMQGLESRVDNSISYNTPKMAGFTFCAQFSTGTDGDEHTHENKAERYTAAGVRYNAGNLDVRAVVDQTLADGHFDSDDKVTAGIAANYKFDFARIYVAYQYAENTTFSNNAGAPFRPDLDHSHAFILSARVPVSGVELMPQIAYVRASGKGDEKGQDFDRLGLTMGASYDLSKNVDLYAAATYARFGQDFKDHEKGDDAWEIMSGIRYSF